MPRHLGTLLLVIGLATPALALPPGPFYGRPAFRPGDRLGALVWQNKRGLQLRFTTRGASHTFKARVCTDKRITAMAPVLLERGDYARVGKKGHCATFSGTVRGGVDGFWVQATGQVITFDLTMDNHPIGTNHIWIGRKEAHPTRSPFLFSRAPQTPKPLGAKPHAPRTQP